MIIITVKINDDGFARETRLELEDTIISPSEIAVDRHNQVDLALNRLKHRISSAYKGSLPA